MKIKILEEGKIICQNRYSRHNYFAWPSVNRLADGSIAMTCSGFRLEHICPFGKVVMCKSTDEGKTWGVPGIVIDTMLDDRDAGIVPFGKDKTDVIVTSFNNTFKQQRIWNKQRNNDPYIDAYCDKFEPLGQDKSILGPTCVISHDGGTTWGDIKNLPVTSPHGPLATPDGKLIYVGTVFCDEEKEIENGVKYNSVQVYSIDRDGNYEKLSEIENVGVDDLYSCEPHAVLLKSGKMIVHIRVQNYGDNPTFTVYQAESYDMGKTWTKPHQLLGQLGGSPAHLLELSDGTLISAYGYRNDPFGVRVMVSYDEGETWDIDHQIFTQHHNADVGYPSSVELNDGSILTVFYNHPARYTPAVIQQVIWKIEK